MSGLIAPLNDPLWGKATSTGLSLWKGDIRALCGHEAIVLDVCTLSRVTIAQIKGPARHRGIVRIRQLLMWRLYRETRLSLPQIGKLLNRDHTTVLSGVRSHEGRLNQAAENLREAA